MLMTKTKLSGIRDLEAELECLVHERRERQVHPKWKRQPPPPDGKMRSREWVRQSIEARRRAAIKTREEKAAIGKKAAAKSWATQCRHEVSRAKAWLEARAATEVTAMPEDELG